MAFIKQETTNFGLIYEYWSIENFSITWENGHGNVEVLFRAYLNKEVKKENFNSFTQIIQTIPFEIFIKGFTEMTGFESEDIKKALYSLKEYYTYFQDAQDDI